LIFKANFVGKNRAEKSRYIYLKYKAVLKGKILDVGAGAGCHSIVLFKAGNHVTALEKSELCSDVLCKRSLPRVVCSDFYSFEKSKYDSILFLMNGIGIAGTIISLPVFLKKAYDLLNLGGQILFDSSDVCYMYKEKERSRLLNRKKYYGELNFNMCYKKIQGEEFPWLYIDFDTLVPFAQDAGFIPQILATGKHYDYLGVLIKH